MDCGKLISQAGHAYVGALHAALGTPEHAAYSKLAPGTKVALQGSLAQLGQAVAKLKQRGIPHYVVVDSGCPDFFMGHPTSTALGIGPVTKAQINNITRRFQLV
jgi:peptidyl-tRNA hydrolase